MKKLFLSKRIWQIYSKTVSAIAGIESLFFLFFPVVSNHKWWAAGNILVFALLFAGLMIVAKRCRKRTIKVSGNRVNIIFGDIFKTSGKKVIAFNEYFDTIVDDKIISKKSLNGIVINEHIIDINSFDSELANDDMCIHSIVGSNADRQSGKKVKYELGTCYKHNQFIAVAFTHFDERNIAFITIPEYLACLTNMWTNLNSIYAGDDLVLPLLGSGITRIRGGTNLEKQELLNILISTLRYSNVQFSHDSTITIVLPDNLMDEINIFTLEY